MERKIKILNDIENYSATLIEQEEDWFKSTKDIIWYANEVSDFSDNSLTEYYKNNQYGKNTRWDVWNNCISVFKKYEIKNMLDIGCANGHLVFLAQNENIDAYGIEPRRNIVKEYQSKFKNKSLFVSNYECFIDFLIDKKIYDFKFDCICATNYMHGKGHDSTYLKKFFENVFKYCDYLLTSEPTWKEYGLDDLLTNTERLECILPTNQHFLFKQKPL